MQVPGTSPNYARLLGLDPHIERSRVVLEAIRLIHSVKPGVEGPTLLLERQARYFDLLTQLSSAVALARSPQGTISLALAERGQRRGQLTDLLHQLGLRLRERSTQYAVELDQGRDEADRRVLLETAGFKTAEIVAQLNTGKELRLEIPFDEVPLPLPPQSWLTSIVDSVVSERDLFATIVHDRHAALLYYGLASLDPNTLDFLATHPDLLRWIYQNAAPLFATFGRSLKVDAGLVTPPGGPETGPLWGRLVDQNIHEPERFFRNVLSRDAGRLAYFYDVIAHLDPHRQRFALGFSNDSRDQQAERINRLYDAFGRGGFKWELEDWPFGRPTDDAGFLLNGILVTDEGKFQGPPWRKFWGKAFDSVDLPDNPAHDLDPIAEGGAVDAAWLAEQVLSGDKTAVVRDRLEQLFFAQRVFSGLPSDHAADALVALRGFPRYRTLLQTLERMGVTDPAILALAVRRADSLTRVSKERWPVLLGQFQGALGILDQVRRTRSIDVSRTTELVRQLAGLTPQGAGEYEGRVSVWLDQQFLSASPAASPGANSIEDRVLRLMAGVANPDTARVQPNVLPIQWEGLSYRVDFPQSLYSKLVAIRNVQGGPTLDMALALWKMASKLGSGTLDVAATRNEADNLRKLQAALPRRTKDDKAVDLLDEEFRHTLDQAFDDLSNMKRPKDAARATKVASSLVVLSDALLARALTTLVYAAHLSGTTNRALLGPEVPRRHDFGAGKIGEETGGVRAPVESYIPTAQGVKHTVDEEERRRVPWTLGAEVTGPGVPYHLVGSLLGLDLVLSERALRYATTGQPPAAPVLHLVDRQVFVHTAAMTNPYTLSDAGRDLIVESVRRGRDQWTDVQAGRLSVEDLGQRLPLSEWRLRSIPWMLRHEPDRLASLLSLQEFFWLGAPERATDVDLDAWGLSQATVTGCWCTRFPRPRPWEDLAGRPTVGWLAAHVSDLSLRIALGLAEVQLPATLAHDVLTVATTDFVNDVPASHADAWMTLVSYPRAISQNRLTDYISALTANGPLISAEATPSSVR